MKSFTLVSRPDTKSAAIAETIRKELIQNGFPENQIQPEEVIVVGGDGTFLRAVHRYMPILNQTAFIGIHTGTLGFFMDYPESEVEALIDDILADHFPVETHPIMEAKVDSNTIYAVNEIRIENPRRTQDIDIALNGSPFERFRGSGVCVCSQLGSSAFNRSLGGAVLQNGLPLFEITEMAGIHDHEYRSLGAPFVISDDTEIRLSSSDFHGAILGSDSEVMDLKDGHEIIIQKSKDKNLRILRGKKITYFERLERLF